MKAIVVFDLGSSSLRCTLYCDVTLEVLARASNDRRSVNFDGSIATDGLFGEIDSLLDQVLQSHDCQASAVGFSSFNMNLVGVNETGEIVGDATMSYASQNKATGNDLTELRRYAMKTKIETYFGNSHHRSGNWVKKSWWNYTKQRALHFMHRTPCRTCE